MGFERVNQTIKDWGRQALKTVQQSSRSKGIHHRESSPSPDDSVEAMTVSFKQRAGDLITAINFNIRRSMFYVRAGAGRGYGGSKGSTWTNAKGERKRTSPDSMGKAGSGSRQAKDFLSEVEASSDALIDEVALATIDEIFNQSF